MTTKRIVARLDQPFRRTQEFVPMGGRGLPVVVETLLMPESDWHHSPESKTGEWSVSPGLRGFVLAVRLPVTGTANVGN